ncbi:MAG TPA: murein L,D-transpeptidase catalytic domain family protein [Rhizomicrobium sp.]|nr:murein L,D-transpeptidase catalytic domain family protein [Rhizomicrobium sp.]
MWTAADFFRRQDPREVIVLLSRRKVLAAATAAGASLVIRPALAAAPAVSAGLLARAMAALDRHQISHRDVVGVADFSAPSRSPRLHLVDTVSGRISSHLVAHGRGSDPRHTGWLERFSNGFGSNATSSGAYSTGDFYNGAHGRSLRLNGLDASNSNALERGIVVHGAWYVSQEMASRGALGRSEGCLALSTGSLEEVFARLGPGHLIYADKIDAA